jgi:hypothetical protein
MANEERLLTALTTEHFTLATARSTAVSESNARATIYLLSVSTTLVAIGFVSQLSDPGNLFEVFSLTVLPTLFVLGLFTFLRLTEISVEDFRYGQAINRIRHYYLELAADQAKYFLLSGNDDRAGVWANMSLRPSHWHSYFTMPMAMAFINTVVGASATALATGVVADLALGGAVAAGLGFAIVSFALHYRHNETRFKQATAGAALFPSAGASAQPQPRRPGQITR